MVLLFWILFSVMMLYATINYADGKALDSIHYGVLALTFLGIILDHKLDQIKRKLDIVK